jgi:two-component system response regulator DesR
MHMLRKALVTLMRLEPGIDVVAEVASADEALAQSLKHLPDVAVLDINLQGDDGFTAARGLRTAVPHCRTLMLTSVARPGHLHRMLDVGALGLMVKDADPARLADAIRSVAAGALVVDPQMAMDALESGPPPLAPRELQALQLVSEGEGAAQIAARLFLSTGTVRNYLANAVTKLGARNRMDAIRIARGAGWL